MPIYGYVCGKCGKTADHYRKVEDRNKLVKCACGRSMKRLFCSVHSTDKPYAKPIYSEALGVNPDQIPEFKKKNPDVDVLPDGRVVLESHSQRQRLLKRLGFRDNDGYH